MALPVVPTAVFALSGIKLLFASFKTFLIFTIVSIFTHMLPKILVGLGVGFVSYQLGSFGLDILFGEIKNGFVGLPADMLAMMKIARVDEFLSIVFGALSARLTIVGMGKVPAKQFFINA